MDAIKLTKNENGFQKASLISKLFFLWVFPILGKGKKVPITEQDLSHVLEEDKSERLGALLESKWKRELNSAMVKKKRHKLLNAFLGLFGKKLTLLSILYCIDGWILAVAQPICLRFLIQSFSNPDEDSWKAYVYTGGLCLATFLHILVLHPCDFEVSRIGMKCRVGVSSLIYRKILLLKSKSDTNPGQITNILLNDTAGFDSNLNFIPFIIVGPVQFIIFMYLLWMEVGIACLAGAGLIVILIPLNYLLGKLMSNFRLKIADMTDKRCNVISDIIAGIRVIKMYAWETSFTKLVDGIRRKEMSFIRKRSWISGLHLATVGFAPKFVPFLIILVYYLMGNEISADKVFFTLVVTYTVIQVSVYCIPQAVTGIGQLAVSIGRIEEFLLIDEQEIQTTTSLANDSSPVPSLTMTHANASWTNGNLAFKDVCLNLSGDQIVMIIGPVGSGKTSILQALLSELPLTSGVALTNGIISYSSQETWLFDGSIQENIIFGTELDTSRYKASIMACGLEPDLAELPFRDGTGVGENGSALSGGQKVRLNLARAVYRKANIYLLDDPLSAVDTTVAHNIFEKCIKTFLKGSLRVLVTHQVQFLPFADHIIVLKNGSVAASGTYASLLRDGYDFDLVLEKEKDNNQPATSDDVGSNLDLNFKENDHKEVQDQGSIQAALYWKYFSAAESTILLIFLLIAFSSSQLTLNGVDIWLSYWTRSPGSGSTSFWEEHQQVLIYALLVLAAILLCLMRTLLFFEMCTRISGKLHDAMLTSVMGAPTKFFDNNPSGRVINRFTKDISTLDELLPTAFADTVAIFLNMLGVSVIVIMANCFLLLPTIGLMVAFYFIRRYFVPTSRSLKRIESISRSPIVTHVRATLQGLDTIRSLKSQQVMIRQFDGLHDDNSAAWFLFIAANRWFGIWLEIASVIFLIFIALGFLLVTTDSSSVGIAIASTLTLTGSFQWGMRQSSATENFMTSVQRILEYAKIVPEQVAGENVLNSNPPKNWPHAGQIKFQNVSLSYKDGRQVLKNLTFEILGQQKIGIVGRTGAGKSSIITALLRMTPLSGDIFIDGVNTKNISLHSLRRATSVIPQDPRFFSASLRFNLDPNQEFYDDQLWNVLHDLHLADMVPNLDMNVANGGSCNFSVGQRQLLCLARAILRKSKIIVMDEATANIDQTTDKFIQTTLQDKFRDCTIITVAHRLNTVMHCDKILVLANGIIKEFDHPHLLLMRPDGLFSAMMTTGNCNTDNLNKIAGMSYYKDKNLETGGDKSEIEHYEYTKL